MIGWLKGTIIRTFDGGVIVNVDGVGYKVFSPNSWQPDEPAELHIHHHIREDQSNLFGFKSIEELECFELLLGVPGVGPKLALVILANLSVDSIRGAIIKSQPAIFQSISGVGAKVAAKIVVELKSKISSGALDFNSLSREDDLVSALTSLGISKSDIRDLIKQLPPDVTELDDKIKWTLKQVGKSPGKGN